jgi:[ribosomal protein S18]-alanine N-acetyltransferase
MSGTSDDPRPAIIRARPRHAGDLASLHARLFDDPWDGEAFAELLRQPGAKAFMARVGDPPEAVGLILGRVGADEAEILSLAVRPDRQRRGLAARLLSALRGAARRARARTLYLEVGASNGAALAFYARRGFRACGRRAAYYRHPGRPAEDALVLSLAL